MNIDQLFGFSNRQQLRIKLESEIQVLCCGFIVKWPQKVFVVLVESKIVNAAQVVHRRKMLNRWLGFMSISTKIVIANGKHSHYNQLMNQTAE